MRIYHTILNRSGYKEALKSRMDSRWRFWEERCTGLFFGSVFLITYHSQKIRVNRHHYRTARNTAIGYLRQSENTGTEINYTYIYGTLAPQYNIFNLLFPLLLLFPSFTADPELTLSALSQTGEVLTTTSTPISENTFNLASVLLIILLLAAVFPALNALWAKHEIGDKSQQILEDILTDPIDGYYDNPAR